MSFKEVNVNVSGSHNIIKALQNYNTVILKPNIVDNRNVLTQEMMSEKHTKYVIRWNYSLEGATINVPEDCIIEFAGGTIDNGIIVGNNTILMYSKPIDEVCLAERQGTFIYNTTVADEEDITSETGQLKFKDKAYNPDAYSGLAKKILRKNMVDGVNTLTQSMVSFANTIYIIQYNFDLGDASVTIPENCVLQFDGGSLSNGSVYLSEFNSVINGIFYNCGIILNTHSKIINTKITHDNSGIVPISFIHSRITAQNFKADVDVILNKIFIRNSGEVSDTAIYFSADKEVEDTDSGGCFNINISNLDIRGPYSKAIKFDGAHSNNFFTQVSFIQVFVYGSCCGWSFMETDGFLSQCSIDSCGYQCVDNTSFGIIACNTAFLYINASQFWDFGRHNKQTIFQFDSYCHDIYFQRVSTSASVKLYEIKDTLNTNWYKNAGTYYSDGEANYSCNLTKYLNLDEEITISDIIKIPNGNYIVFNTSANRQKLLTNWGILSGDSNTCTDVIFKKQQNATALILSAATVNLSWGGNKWSQALPTMQIIEGVITSNNLLSKIKNLWISNQLNIIRNATGLSRIDQPYQGLQVFRGIENTPIWYTGTRWVNADGFAVAPHTGTSENRPAGLAAGGVLNPTYDIGFEYFDKTINKPIYVSAIAANGTVTWVDATGATV